LVATRRHRAPEVWAEWVERAGNGLTEEVPLNPVERGREMLLMGLRLTEGIDELRFAARTGLSLDEAVQPEILTAAMAEGYVERRSGRLRATAEGRKRLDSLLVALVA
jgi:oxygen-independent coproporphyrinogen-3 oxidase